MRTVKIVAGLAGGIIVLLVATLLAVWLFVNPNDYKGKIAAAVKESTGRELKLNGDIKLSVFPWVALELGPASLGNPPGFDAEPFLAFNHAAVRVRLLPLLSKRLDIDRVQLDGLDLRLRKNAQGTGNWENFGKAQEAPAKSEGTTSASLSQLAGIAVTHGRVSYQGLVVQNINLETGAFRGRGVTPVSLTFDANRGVPGEQVTLDAKFSLDADPAAKQFKLVAVSLSGMLGRANDGGPEHWEMTAPAIDVNLGAQTLAVPAFAMSYSNAHVTGKLQATKIIDDLSMTGSVALAPLVLREFASRLGIALPKTSDPHALSQFSAAGDFSYAASGMRFEQMQIQLDDTHLKGSVAMVGEPRALKFDLAVDKIDIDRYMPGAGGSGDAAAGAPKTARAAAANPKDAAKPMDADGTLTLGAVHFSPLDFTSVRFTLASKGGVMRLFPSQALIDGGRYSGDITVDTRGAVPIISLDEHLSGIDMARLLANSSYKGRLSGHGNVNLKATTRGAALEPVLKSLNGHFDANLTGGAIEGMDIGYELGAAQALIHREAPQGVNTKRTAFDAFKMSAEITNGVAKTSDLLISSPVLRVKGQGSANLPTKAIDFQMMASLLKSSTSTVADIPLKITGTYVDPTVRPDVDALAKGQVKQKLQELLEKKGLKGLFSR